MKRWICVLLIAWLPVFMVTADAMGMQMRLQQSHHVVQQSHHVVQQPNQSCHHAPAKQTKNKTSLCILCGFCALAIAIAPLDFTPSFDAFLLTSTRPIFVDVIFTSNNLAPALRPPIFS